MTQDVSAPGHVHTCIAHAQVFVGPAKRSDHSGESKAGPPYNTMHPMGAHCSPLAADHGSCGQPVVEVLAPPFEGIPRKAARIRKGADDRAHVTCDVYRINHECPLHQRLLGRQTTLMHKHSAGFTRTYPGHVLRGVPRARLSLHTVYRSSSSA